MEKMDKNPTRIPRRPGLLTTFGSRPSNPLATGPKPKSRSRFTGPIIKPSFRRLSSPTLPHTQQNLCFSKLFLDLLSKKQNFFNISPLDLGTWFGIPSVRLFSDPRLASALQSTMKKNVLGRKGGFLSFDFLKNHQVTEDCSAEVKLNPQNSIVDTAKSLHQNIFSLNGFWMLSLSNLDENIAHIMMIELTNKPTAQQLPVYQVSHFNGHAIEEKTAIGDAALEVTLRQFYPTGSEPTHCQVIKYSSTSEQKPIGQSSSRRYSRTPVVVLGPGSAPPNLGYRFQWSRSVAGTKTSRSQRH